MWHRGRMSEEYGSLIDIRKIDAFLQSDVAGRMAAAQEKDCCLKKQPFVLSVAADRSTGRISGFGKGTGAGNHRRLL